jgi:hypothetical protein
MRREEEAQLQREKEDRAERRERWKERRMQLAASEESEFESDDSSSECTYDWKQQSTGLLLNDMEKVNATGGPDRSQTASQTAPNLATRLLPTREVDLGSETPILLPTGRIVWRDRHSVSPTS